MLKMDNITDDDDLMSKIMNRKLGGITSSFELSPRKGHAVHLEESNLSNLDNCSLSTGSFPYNESYAASCSKSELYDESDSIDEIDGFAEGNLKNEIEKGVEHVEGAAKTYIEVTEFKKNVGGFNDSLIKPEKGTGENHGEYEYTMASTDDKGSTEPRIEMFNESDSNSTSNPFILSSFQSLNTSKETYSQEMIAERETETGKIIKDEIKSIRRNIDSCNSGKSWDYQFRNDKNTEELSGRQDHAFKNENKVPRSEKSVESQDGDHVKLIIPVDLSDNTNRSEKVSFDIYSEDEGSAQGGRETEWKEDLEMSHINCEETANYSDVNDDSTSTYFDEPLTKIKNTTPYNTFKARMEKEERSVGRKSRKQNVPKRIMKLESSAETRSDEENDMVAKYIDIDHKILEKSRKQYQPKRIDQLQSINDKDSIIYNESTELVPPGLASSINDDSEIKSTYMVKNEEDLKIENDQCKIIECKNLNYTSCEGNIYGRDKDKDRNDKVSKDLEECSVSSITDNESENSLCSSQKTSGGGSIDHFASMSSNPFYYGFSPDISLISSLTPGILQGGASSPGGFALDGPENLEVIRQLREIRCNRYRKISIAEKREISAYANSHGVSQAATYYNVSKSAVSMWTKLDFSNADEESAMKRKNCMSGNEKFEALCRTVKNERENKFKGMSKLDKFEVSRYAKLVGVREMSRCLGVALGTVSGWMRQFPYKIETDSLDDSNEKDGSKTKHKGETQKTESLNEKSVKRKKSDRSTKDNKKQKSDALLETDSYKTIQKDNTMYILPIDEGPNLNDSIVKNGNEAVETSMNESDLDCSSEQKDELDKMIAETWQKPDIEKCFEDVKDMIKDSPLEGDDFFRSLFERVIACRADKYKSLKPSEKLEVVRYAKRIGVRRIAKILGLATGTLSGWNTKYQSSLGITDPGLDMANKNDLLVSYLTPDKGEEGGNVTVTQGALMDNGEKSEVTAVKLLFKDRFPGLLKKIEIAKQVKFKNIATEEKIEFVKCSKLVGIRPTARVFGIPIGTLSGWISKYSRLLHPAYHVDVDQDGMSNSSESPGQSSNPGMFNPSMAGQIDVVHSSNATAWPPMPGFMSGDQEMMGLNLFPHLKNVPSASSSTESFSSLSHTNETVSKYLNPTVDVNEDMRTSQNIISNGNHSFIGNSIENQSNSSVVTSQEDFEKEAKIMAEQYLTAAYKTMGIPLS